MNGIVAMYGGWMNGGAMLYTGVQDYTGGPGSPYKFRVDDADTEHFVIAFGYAGGVTTDPVMKTFRTKPAPDAKDTSFELKSSNITPYSFALAVIPSESTTYWTTDIILPEEFNEKAIIENWNKDIKDYILMDEALHEKKIAQIAEKIQSRNGVRLILIAGPSSSGKTTFSNKLFLLSYTLSSSS